MVEIIGGVLGNIVRVNSNDDIYCNSDYYAEEILTAIEKAGMLPPERFNSPVKNQTCEWEAEDET